MGSETMTVEQLYSVFSKTEINIALISIAIGCLFVAFFSFRLLKVTVIIEMVCLGFLYGVGQFSMLTGDVKIGLAVGVLLAIICGVLSLKFFKVMIYLYGALMGALFGFVFTYELFFYLGLESVGTVVSLIVAVLLAMVASVLLYKYFKPYVIIGTSLSASSMALSALHIVIFGGSESLFVVFEIAGFVLGIFAAITQFKMNEGYELDL